MATESCRSVASIARDNRMIIGANPAFLLSCLRWPGGWVGLRLDPPGDWEEVAELVLHSYC